MKKLLPALFLFLFALGSCKKEKLSQIAISGISPASGPAGTVVTISGTNLGATTNVYFSGVAGSIQSITSTEIKAKAPASTSGNISVTIDNQRVTGPVFTYTSILTSPYTTGDVTLTSQADVNGFVAQNKGRQLQISGDLNIQGLDITSVAGLSNITSVSGQVYFLADTALTDAPFLNTINYAGSLYILSCGFTSLSFNSLNAFSGLFHLNNLYKLKHVDFTNLTTPSSVFISNSPLLTDLSFLNSIKSTGGILLHYLRATELNMNNLTTTAGIDIYGCDLKTISMKSLTSITGIVALSLKNSPSLSNLDFTALTSITGKLTLSGSNILNMSGFSSLKSSGSITLFGNPLLLDIQGLSNLTALTSAAVGSSPDGSNAVSFGGIDIELNPKLTSLAGLQNISTVPIIMITGNTGLNDFCPLKGPINVLKSLPAISYTAEKMQSDRTVYYTASVPTLTLSQNSTYFATQDALAAVALCK